MSILARFSQIRAGIRRARQSFDAFEQMNALPYDLQRDIGWTVDNRVRAGAIYNGL